MENKVSITVVIAVYNAEKYLSQCITSILQQSQKDIEVICVDDNSKDQSLDILKAFAALDNRLQVYHHKNCGPGASRNWGATFATGKYIIFLDADDFFELNFLKTMYEEAEKKCNDITICNYYSYDDKTQEEHKISAVASSIFNNRCFSGSEIKDVVFEYQGFRGAVWNKLYRRDFLLQIGDYFLESRKCDGCEDLFFSLIASFFAKRISIISRPLVHYRENINTALKMKKYSTLMETPFFTLLAIYRELIKRDIYQPLKDYYTCFVIKHLYGYFIDKRMPYTVKKEFYHKLKSEWWPACGVDYSSIANLQKSKYPELLIYEEITRQNFDEYEAMLRKKDTAREKRMKELLKGLSGRNLVIWGKGSNGYQLRREIVEMGYDLPISFVDINSEDESEKISLLIGKVHELYVLVSMGKYYPQVVDFLQSSGYEKDKDYWYINL